MQRNDNESQGLGLAPGETLWPEELTVEGTVYKTDELAGALDAIATWSHDVTASKGFYDGGEGCTELALIALAHSELGEATKALAIHNPPSEKIPGYSQVEEELADVVHRVLCLGKEHGHDVVSAVIAKGFYNEGRPPRHGGKKF